MAMQVRLHMTRRVTGSCLRSCTARANQTVTEWQLNSVHFTFAGTAVPTHSISPLDRCHPIFLRDVLLRGDSMMRGWTPHVDAAADQCVRVVGSFLLPAVDSGLIVMA
jgi:hypothetical protein